MIRKRILSAVLAALSLPLAAQGGPDSVLCFRFIPGRDAFLAGYGGNSAELDKLLDCVERYKTRILGGGMPLHVDGYSRAAGTEAADLALAKIRSNRVKSELITRKGLKEACFVTRNHAGEGDFVTVRLILQKKDAEARTPAHTRTGKDTGCSLPPAAGSAETVPAETPAASSTASVPATTGDNGLYRFALRANLLRWATLTPDLGIEWRINPSWGILVNGSWTSWTWNDKNRRYALWEVSPEVRYYIGKEKRGYLGAMYKVGQFNYKFSATGKQGDLTGGSITGGYRLRLNRSLDLDFSLGMGYLRADYDRYTVTGGVRVRDGKGSKDWWGPVSAGITLTWNIF